jgi:Peptidase A4 family
MRRSLLAVLALPVLLLPAGPVQQAISRAPLQRVHTTIARGTVYSLNWAGYAAFKSGLRFTDVKATWVQPTANCPTSKKTLAAFFVGIDGYNSNSVEQIGTDADCVGANQPSHYAWYEMYPSPPVYLSKTTYRVSPGDTLTAEVSFASSVFTLKLHSSRGWTFQTTKTLSGAARSSAEWIAEAPSRCSPGSCTVLPLTNFGTINFSGSSATGGGHTGSISYSGWNNDKVIMLTKSRIVRAQTSGLTSSGSAFSVQWKHG